MGQVSSKLWKPFMWHRDRESVSSLTIQIFLPTIKYFCTIANVDKFILRIWIKSFNQFGRKLLKQWFCFFLKKDKCYLTASASNMMTLNIDQSWFKPASSQIRLDRCIESKQELICSQKRRVSTFLKHLNTNCHFFTN